MNSLNFLEVIKEEIDYLKEKELPAIQKKLASNARAIQETKDATLKFLSMAFYEQILEKED